MEALYEKIISFAAILTILMNLLLTGCGSSLPGKNAKKVIEQYYNGIAEGKLDNFDEMFPLYVLFYLDEGTSDEYASALNEVLQSYYDYDVTKYDDIFESVIPFYRCGDKIKVTVKSSEEIELERIGEASAQLTNVEQDFLVSFIESASEFKEELSGGTDFKSLEELIDNLYTQEGAESFKEYYGVEDDKEIKKKLMEDMLQAFTEEFPGVDEERLKNINSESFDIQSVVKCITQLESNEETITTDVICYEIEGEWYCFTPVMLYTLMG